MMRRRGGSQGSRPFRFFEALWCTPATAERASDAAFFATDCLRFRTIQPPAAVDTVQINDGARSSARRLFPTRHICKRREEIFLALAFEPLLSRFEIRHPHSDFLALSCPAIVFFGHPIPFGSCLVTIGVRD
jgi:hypothetical protein